jgi:hypothetical protein
MNARMTRLQQESDRSRVASVSLTHQFLQQSSGGNTSNTKGNATADVPMTITMPAKSNTGITSTKQEARVEDSKPSAITGVISATMETMLEKYIELDDESKKALMHHAITSNNEVLKHRLIQLRESYGNNNSIAKLTKEIIKLAENCKVPEHKFDEQAKRHRLNFQTWIMKLKPILAMFPQTAKVLPVDTAVPFADPITLGTVPYTSSSAPERTHIFNEPLKSMNHLVIKCLN